MKLQNKHILLGLTGSIAAYKSPELIRSLQREGATVQVMVTPSALRFVTKLTLQALSGFPVLDSLFDGENAFSHLHSSRKADLIVVAPLTAHSLAKFAAGMADDIVSVTVLAARCPVLVVPAMNDAMWRNPLVQDNLSRIQKAGYFFLEPEIGTLACGEYGTGKMTSPLLITHEVIRLCTEQDLKGKKVLITGGSTREYLDPVRYLSNASSGKMACALALEAYYRGAEVTLLHGYGAAFDQELPRSLKIFATQSVSEMEKRVFQVVRSSDLFVSAAAVSDFTPQQKFQQKIKKNKDIFQLMLKGTSDILQKVLALKKRPFVVGFALESGSENNDFLRFGRQKFQKKKVDLMVLNSPAALDSDVSKVFFFSGNRVVDYPILSKEDISKNIFDFYVKSLLRKRL